MTNIVLSLTRIICPLRLRTYGSVVEMSLDLTLNNLEFNFNVINSYQNKVYDFEDFSLDSGHKLLYRNGEQISLTPKAVETLLALVERQGEVVGKDELMKAIWGETIVEESNLAQYLHLLRKTLGVTRDGKSFIETLKRRGYRFNGVVSISENLNGSQNSKYDRAQLDSLDTKQSNGHLTAF